jgi:two-component system CheB/CheR fusion protein
VLECCVVARQGRVKTAARTPVRAFIRPTFVVGLGGSAGSLDALEQFFASAAGDTGMAFVLALQLDPAEREALPELLRRTTSMPVRLLEGSTRPTADTVYVIPPNRGLVIEDNSLRVQPPGREREARAPLDTFFTSLAHERGRQAIGVVLSGASADGAVGLRAIKEAGGAVLVQEPASAARDALPLAALAAVVPDAVAGPDQLPAKLAAIGRGRSPNGGAVAFAEGEATARALARVLDIVRARTEHDLTQHKRSALERGIDRRLAFHRLSGLDAYADHLDADAGEAELLARELLVGAAHFFRDEDAFTVLRDQALPALLEARTGMRTMRAWVAGCSSGEEAYTLAIVIHEALAKLGQSAIAAQVYATDADEGALAIARAGRYSSEIEQHVATSRLSRYFVREEHGYRIKKEIRDTVVFAQHDLSGDPPCRQLDVVSCRGVLAHLPPEQQQRLLPRFRQALVSDGILVLGASESVASSPELFLPVGDGAGVFRCAPADRRYISASTRGDAHRKARPFT